MRIRNIKNLFVTILISSVSFLLNVLPVNAQIGEGFSGGLGADMYREPTKIEIVKGFLKIWTVPIAIVIVLVILVVRFYKKKKGEQE